MRGFYELFKQIVVAERGIDLRHVGSAVTGVVISVPYRVHKQTRDAERLYIIEFIVYTHKIAAEIRKPCRIIACGMRGSPRIGFIYRRSRLIVERVRVIKRIGHYRIPDATLRPVRSGKIRHNVIVARCVYRNFAAALFRITFKCVIINRLNVVFDLEMVFIRGRLFGYNADKIVEIHIFVRNFVFHRNIVPHRFAVRNFIEIDRKLQNRAFHVTSFNAQTNCDVIRAFRFKRTHKNVSLIMENIVDSDCRFAQFVALIQSFVISCVFVVCAARGFVAPAKRA